MKTVNIIVPFNSTIRQTLLPESVDWVHVTPESDDTVCVQVRGEDAVIDAMIADPANLFLEDVGVAPAAPLLTEEGNHIETELGESILVGGALECDSVEIRAFMVDKFGEEDVCHHDWSSSQNAIISTVALHGQTMENFKASRLGTIRA